jgi:signal transduction histidine kinase
MHHGLKRDFLIRCAILLCVSMIISVLIGLSLLILDRFSGLAFPLSIVNSMLLFATVSFTVATSSLIYGLLRSFVYRYLPSSPICVSHELSKISSKLISILDFNELVNLVTNTVYDLLALKNIALLVYNKDSNSYICVTSAGLSITEMSHLSLEGDDLLIATLRSNSTCIYRDTIIKSLSWQDASIVSHSFARLRSLYVLPVMYEGQIIGLLCLSAKKNEKRLLRKEIVSLQGLSAHLGPALHNATTMNSLKKINNELVDTQSQLLQTAKMSALEKLAAGIAHEIHNPLTIISGKAQVLLLKGEKKLDAQKVTEVLTTIVQQTKRAADITRRLLMFAKPQQIETKRLISIESVINDTISLVSYQVSLDEIRIVKIIESNTPFIAGSLLEVRELFLNLILNSIQAIGTQGVITIVVKHIEKDGLVKISIADTGKGIPKEKTVDIFDPFYTTKVDCVGLGLFVSQQIVNRMGGAIKVDSAPGTGSVFNVLLPVPLRITSRHSGESVHSPDQRVPLQENNSTK